MQNKRHKVFKYFRVAYELTHYVRECLHYNNDFTSATQRLCLTTKPLDNFWTAQLSSPYDEHKSNVIRKCDIVWYADVSLITFL